MQSDPLVSVRGFPIRDSGFSSPPATSASGIQQDHGTAVDGFSFGTAEQQPSATSQRLEVAVVTGSSAPDRGKRKAARQSVESVAARGQFTVAAASIALDLRRRQPEASGLLHHGRRLQQEQQEQQQATSGRTKNVSMRGHPVGIAL